VDNTTPAPKPIEDVIVTHAGTTKGCLPKHSDDPDARAVLDSQARDWAVLAVTTTVLHADSRETAEEIAAKAPHLTVISRVPGGEWQPVTNPDEPTQYVFLVEGDMQVGTLDDYAKAWEGAYYSSGHVSPDVRTWSGASFNVSVEPLGNDKDSWMRYRLSVGDEAAFVTIDGRA
jgi:hypothetical protein